MSDQFAVADDAEQLADHYLREAGYDPDLVRGRTTLRHISDQRRRAKWRIQNSKKRVSEKQVGLFPPPPVISDFAFLATGILALFLTFIWILVTNS